MSDLFDMLRRLGLRLSREALDALLTHAQKNRLSPAQVLEQVCVIEQRERDARNLARRATVRFSTVPAALVDLLRQESLPATERRLRRYTAPDLLILDELGYVPSDSRAADLLFNIVSRRHEKRSIVITTNLAYKQWGSVFHDASCLGALVDRFAQHCHTIDVDADSWRNKEAQLRAKAKKKPPEES